MISPKYRELDKEKLAKEEKYAKKHVKSAFLNNPKAGFWSRKKFITALMTFLLLIWLINFSLISDSSSAVQSCVGDQCVVDICQRMSKNLVSGNLCMDMCVQKTLNIPSCSEDRQCQNPYYSYYSANGYESTFICASNDKDPPLFTAELEIIEFYTHLGKKIEERIHHPLTAEHTINQFIGLADVNFDQKISLAEANNIWLLANNRHTFYMISLAGKSYVPEIKSFCGSFVEVEKILNQVYLKKDSYIESVLPINFNWFWPDWNYRCKIALGILEFFIDATSFNPNDEFGADSLFMCSKIESSFGATFLNEAKITNYNEILNGRELQTKLADVFCKRDEDCFYTKQCHTKCNLNTNKCTSDLIKPQIVHYCEFLKEYLFDNATASEQLIPTLKKCETLTTLTRSNKVLYQSNEMPMSYNMHQNYIEQINYRNKSIEYASVLNTLKSQLWNFIKFSKDPVTKKNKKITSTVAHPV